MAIEYLVKRSIYTAKCGTCGEDNTKTENPPKERFCATCQIWVPYKEESYTGPDLRSR